MLEPERRQVFDQVHEGSIDKSNRLAAGLERRRQDQDPAEALNMIKYMKEAKKGYPDDKSFFRAMVMRYRPKTKVQLQNILAKEEV